jgi:hypothetical protein
MTSLSTEKHISGVWNYWNKYCLEKNRPLVYPPYGMGVYRHKAEDFTSNNNPPAEENHRPTVHGFYNFLLGPDVMLGKTTLSTVVTFLNAHIKAAFLVHLKGAGSENICISTITVGTDPAIK